MKKFFTFIAAAALAMSAFATDYAGKITVSINGEGGTQETTINIVQNEDGTYKLSINNFALDNDGSPMGVGNIVLDNMKGYTINGVTTVVADQNITITDGDDPNMPFWLGPMLGEVPIILAAQFDGTKAKADIDIDMRSALEQFIYVKFETPDYNGKFGDVDGDGVVTAGDITAIYNILLGN
ncbi:MAG: hypothetical protein IKX31_07690 [Muribaculaceae bacterium]|nr:hypothetical protein [Muribaculaceae bacterium]